MALPLHESQSLPEEDPFHSGTRPDGFPMAVPDTFAPALSLSLMAGKAVSSLRLPRIQWGKPAHHAAVATVASGHVAALWWALFLYGGNDSAATFVVLMSSLIPGTMVGGYVSSLVHDAIQAPVLESGVKPRLARISRALGTEELTPSLMGSLGLADFEYNRRMYQLVAMEHELNLHHNLEERRLLREAERNGSISPAESTLLKKYDEAVASSIASLIREGDHLAQVGLSLPRTVLAIMERENGSVPRFARLAPVAGKKGLNRGAEGSVSALWGTGFAAAAMTAGAMILGYGPPEWTENTQGLFAFLGASTFVNTFFGYVYQRTVQENIYYYQIRPLESRINRWFKSWFGRDVFPIAAGMLGIPDAERYRTLFDRSVANCSNSALRLEGRAVRLRPNGSAGEEELERLATWEDAIERWRDLRGSIKKDLDKINA